MRVSVMDEPYPQGVSLLGATPIAAITVGPANSMQLRSGKPAAAPHPLRTEPEKERFEAARRRRHVPREAFQEHLT
jgi:hypothetical protein